MSRRYPVSQHYQVTEDTWRTISLTLRMQRAMRLYNQFHLLLQNTCIVKYVENIFIRCINIFIGTFSGEYIIFRSNKFDLSALC